MGEPVDVAVIGAGLAGLSCALHCQRRGLSVRVLEAGERVGGRIRTDLVDGYRLDRGFQVLNTAYPEAARILDLAALRLSAFTAGAAVYRDGGRHRIANPLRWPAAAVESVAAPVGTLRGKAALGLASALSAAAPGAIVTALLQWIGPTRDHSAAHLIERTGMGTMAEPFLQPFLRGVLLDDDLSATSARFAALVWRSFARGRVAVPALGMGEIPRQLARRLEDGTLHTGARVHALGGAGTDRHVDLEAGERVRARSVVVATDPVAAGALTRGPASGSPPMRGVTTFWHQAPFSPLDEPLLVLDGEDPLVANTVVMSNVSPTYLPGASTGRTEALVATSVLGTRGNTATERAVRRRLATLYGTSTASWGVIAVHEIAGALPSFPPGAPLRKAVRLDAGLYICGDHRDTPSIQGALVSGRRAAAALIADLDRPER